MEPTCWLLHAEALADSVNEVLTDSPAVGLGDGHTGKRRDSQNSEGGRGKKLVELRLRNPCRVIKILSCRRSPGSVRSKASLHFF